MPTSPERRSSFRAAGAATSPTPGTGPENFLSENPHFAKSALSRYTQWDFLALVERYGIAWHEKTLGQLFCDGSARQIVAMLLEECSRGGVDIRLSTAIGEIGHADGGSKRGGRQGTPARDRDRRSVHPENGRDGRGL
jgi:predicted flavoprotein YhiN